MTISQFIQQLSETPALWITVVLTAGRDPRKPGWTDAPNAIATCVATRAMKPRNAIAMAAVFNFLGVLVMTLLSPKVAETIYNMVDFGSNAHEASIALSAAMFAIVVWAVLAWAFGIPTSESHALIAGITGSAIAMHNNLDGVNGAEWGKVLFGLVFSLVIGFALGYAVTKLIQRLCRRMNYRKANGFFDQRTGGRRRRHGLHARRAGRPEIYGRISAGASPRAGQRFSRRGQRPRMADDFMFSRHGVRDFDRGHEDHQIGGYGYGEAGKIPGLCRRYLRNGGAACLFRNGYARIDDARQNERDYGRGRGETDAGGQLERSQGNGVHLDTDFPRMRADRISDDKAVYFYILKYYIGASHENQKEKFRLF